MSQKCKISPRQFRLLVIMCYLGTSLLFMPSILAIDAKQDAWIANIIGVIFSLMITIIYNSLSNYMDEMHFVKFIEKLVGKLLGKIISIFFMTFIFINCATLINIVGDFITTQIMPETPIEFTIFLFIITIVVGSRLGIEVIARTAEILYPVIIFFLVMLIGFLLPQIDMEKLKPILSEGLGGSFHAGIHYISYTSLPLVVIMIFFPVYVNDIHKGKRAFLYGTIIGGIIMFCITILSILIMGSAMTSRLAFSSYKLAKKVSIAEIIERIEAITAVLWFITIFFKTTLFFYGSVLSLSHILNLKDYRALTFPMAMILMVLSLIIYPNRTFADNWNTTTWVPYVTYYALILPLFLLIVAMIKKSINTNKYNSKEPKE